MIPTTMDYTGRTVDLEVFQTEAVPAERLRLELTAASSGKHRRVAGVQKLVQRYLLTLLTSKGSVRYMPERGTKFMAYVAGGLLQSRTDIVQYFAFSDSDAAAQLKSQDASQEGQGLPADEKYSRSYLMDYLIDPAAARLYLKVRLLSQADTAYTFVIPVI